MTSLRLRGARPVGAPDLLPVVVCLTALAVFLLHGLEGWITRDRSFYVYAGQQVLSGHPPYVAVANRSGPLAHLFPAASIWLGRLVGLPDAVAARAGCLVLAVAAVVVVYLLCRDLFGSRAVGLAGAAAMLSFHGLTSFASDGPNPKVGMVLFFALFLLAVLRRHWFRAGLWVGIAALFLQIVGPPALGAFVTTLVLVGRGRRLRAVLRLVAGAVVPLVLCVGYFLAVGALHAAVENYWVINRRYTTADPFWFHPDERLSDLLDGYGQTLWVLVVGLVAVVVLAAPALWRRGARATSETGQGTPAAPSRGDAGRLLPVAVATLLFLGWSMTDFDGWADAFPGLPLAAIGVAALVAELGARVRPRVAVAVATAAAVLLTADGLVYAVGTRDHALVTQRAVVRALDERLPPGATFFTMQSPEVLALGGHHSISRYLMFNAGFEDYVDDTWPGGLTGFGRWVADQRPTVITVELSYGPPAWLRPVLKDYQRVLGDPWLVYVRRSLGERTRAEIRRALATAWAPEAGRTAPR